MGFYFVHYIYSRFPSGRQACLGPIYFLSFIRMPTYFSMLPYSPILGTHRNGCLLCLHLCLYPYPYPYPYHLLFFFFFPFLFPSPFLSACTRSPSGAVGGSSPPVLASYGSGVIFIAPLYCSASTGPLAYALDSLARPDRLCCFLHPDCSFQPCHSAHPS